jgi:hypothetical protein
MKAAALKAPQEHSTIHYGSKLDFTANPTAATHFSIPGAMAVTSAASIWVLLLPHLL